MPQFIDQVQVAQTIGELADLPCWAAKPGYGTFLTFDFGRTIDKDGLHGKRRARGEIRLWIYLARWQLETSTGAADFDTQWSDIEVLLREFVGCRLLRLQSEGGRHTFHFEAPTRKCRLIVMPDGESDPTDDVFLLYLADGRVMTCNQEGRFEMGLGSDPA